jgi:serine/threonine-protein kinase
MSPEQLDAAKDVDPRADIWALGTILYELVAGRTPFYAETIPQLVHAVMSSAPPPFANLGVTVPPEFEAAVMKALAKLREERYDSVSSFARSIAAFGPAHAMISVLRTERVMSASADGASRPLKSSPVATGQTPTNLGKHDDTVATRTLDVNVAGAPKGAETPATWGGSSGSSGSKSRRGLFVLLTLVAAGAGAIAATVLREPKAEKKTPVAQEAPPIAAAAPSPAPAPSPELPPAASPPSPAPEPAESAVPPPAAATTASPTAVTPGAARVSTLPRAKPASSAAHAAASSALPPKTAPGGGISDFGGRR